MFYAVKVSAAKMPTSCWGKYIRVGVLEVEDDTTEISMISERARGVLRVVRTWERRHQGKTDRCAASVAITEAQELADELNASITEAAAS